MNSALIVPVEVDDLDKSEQEVKFFNESKRRILPIMQNKLHHGGCSNLDACSETILMAAVERLINKLGETGLSQYEAGEIENIYGYLFTICRNLLSKYLRDCLVCRRDVDSLDDDNNVKFPPLTQTEELTYHGMLIEEIQNILSNKERVLFDLLIEELGNEETFRIVKESEPNLSAETFRQRLHRLRKKIKPYFS